MVKQMAIHQISHRIIIHVEDKEETMETEEEVEANLIMVEINNIFHHKPFIISLLSMFLLRIFLNKNLLRIFLKKNLLKVSSMKDHHAKSVGSLEIKPWIVITEWTLLIKAKILH